MAWMETMGQFKGTSLKGQANFNSGFEEVNQ
jgi:hypothetical protein